MTNTYPALTGRTFSDCMSLNCDKPSSDLTDAHLCNDHLDGVVDCVLRSLKKGTTLAQRKSAADFLELAGEVFLNERNACDVDYGDCVAAADYADCPISYSEVSDIVNEYLWDINTTN